MPSVYTIEGASLGRRKRPTRRKPKRAKRARREAIDRFANASSLCRRLARDEGEDYGACMRSELETID